MPRGRRRTGRTSCSSMAGSLGIGRQRSSPMTPMARAMKVRAKFILAGFSKAGPSRTSERPNAPPFPVAGNWFGTTIRVYDPTIDAWRIYWIDPARNIFRQQLGRPRGLDIVQEGKTETGALSRWSFTNITPNSFHWLGESSASRDGPWQLMVEVLARRRAA